MKYKCNKIEDLLAPYLDNVLEPELKIKVEEHLAECQKCKNLSEDLQKILSLSGSMDITQVPADLLNKITDRIEDIKSAKSYQPALRWATAAAVVFVCGITGYYFLTKEETKQTPQQQIIAGKVEMPQSEMASIPSLNKSGKSKITEEKKISEKIIELAKLPEQMQDKEIVFRGGESLKKKKFLSEWKGFSEGKENDKYLIINNQIDWDNIWHRHLKGMVPEIDFNKDIILSVFSEANELQITEIKESKDIYYVKVKETLGKEEKSETIPGNPFHIVVLKK